MTTQTPAQKRLQSIAQPSAKIDMKAPPGSHDQLRSFLKLEKVQNQVTDIVPKHLTPERVTALMLSATLRNQGLLKCSMMSILQAMITVGELGLEPSPSFGHLYLIPYDNRKLGITECQVTIAYGGLAQLVYNATGMLLDTVPVFHGEPFQAPRGSNPCIMHETLLDIDDSDENFKGAYCIAPNPKGRDAIEVMSKAKIDKIRMRSKTPNAGPWVTDYVEMARKTVLRRLTKRLPKSAENQNLARALEKEDSEYEQDGEETTKPALPPSRSIVTVPFDITAPSETAQQQAAPVAEEEHDENGVLPDEAPSLPENADATDKLIHALRTAPDVDALKALKPQVEASRGQPRYREIGNAFSEAADRVKQS